MNSEYLEKWRKFDQILEEHSFEIKHTIDDWKHCYYSDNFDGHLEYDIESDELIIFDENNEELVELSESKLDEINLLNSLVSIMG